MSQFNNLWKDLKSLNEDRLDEGESVKGSIPGDRWSYLYWSQDTYVVYNHGNVDHQENNAEDAKKFCDKMNSEESKEDK